MLNDEIKIKKFKSRQEKFNKEQQIKKPEITQVIFKI